MTSVRWRIFILTTLTLGVFLSSSYSLFNAYHVKVKIAESLRQSYQAESLALSLIAFGSPLQIRQKLEFLGQHMTPQHRQMAIKEVLDATYQSDNNLIKNRVQFFMRNELEFRRFQRLQLRYYNDRLRYFAGLAFLTVLVFLVLLVFYLQRSIFEPLHSLSKRMLDFLHDRYTYQFTVPVPNEVGHLQSTFNSLAQRVLRNMEELTSLDNAKSEFLSIASHELRTPLTSIKGSLSLMKGGVVGPMNDMAQNLLHIAEDETDRLIRLINELLDLAKIEAGKFEVHPEWSSLNEMIDKTLLSLHGLAQTASVHIVVHPFVPVQVLMDKDRIQQVLTNLLSNAIKFSPKGKQVEVAVNFNQDQVLTVHVIDHGRGIAPEDQEAIFQKFRQATSSKNPLVKGTGLGLTIAKALVEEHGGSINVESKPGEGSTFYFTLPKWQYSQETERTQTSTFVPPSTKAAA